MINFPQRVWFINLCDMTPLNIAQISYYESYAIQYMIRCFSDVSEKCHPSTPYDSYQSIYDSYQHILSHKINTPVLTRIVFSTDTIVPAEYSHICSFNPIKFHPLIGYNRIINKIWVYTNSPKYPLLDHNIFI